MAGGVGGEFYSGDGVRGVEGDCLDEGQGGEDVGFGEELGDVAVGAGGSRGGAGRCCGGGVRVLHPDRVLHEPFVDCFCRVRHVHAALEVGFGEDVGEGGGVVHVETGGRLVLAVVLLFLFLLMRVMWEGSFLSCWLAGCHRGRTTQKN